MTLTLLSSPSDGARLPSSPSDSCVVTLLFFFLSFADDLEMRRNLLNSLQQDIYIKTRYFNS